MQIHRELAALLPTCLHAACTTTGYVKGARLFATGDKPVHMFFIASGEVVLERAGFLEKATNNQAEYLAVVTALEEVAAADPEARVLVQADSKLVVEQLSGNWKIKNAELLNAFPFCR